MTRLFVVELPSISLIPADTVTMSFVTSSSPPGLETPANDALARTAFAEFFTQAATGNTDPMGLHISPSRSRAVGISKIKTYDLDGFLDGSPHGSPSGQSSFTMPGSDSTKGLPDEVALCVRLETIDRASEPVEEPDGADPGTLVDRPKQRHTGRIFFGPLSSLGTHSDESSGHNRPHATFISNVIDAVQQLNTSLMMVDSDGYRLSVWSRVDATVRWAKHVAVDNAWDVQRRRGPKPSALQRDDLYV